MVDARLSEINILNYGHLHKNFDVKGLLRGIGHAVHLLVHDARVQQSPVRPQGRTPAATYSLTQLKQPPRVCIKNDSKNVVFHHLIIRYAELSSNNNFFARMHRNVVCFSMVDHSFHT
jgi:hypothetical protein